MHYYVLPFAIYCIAIAILIRRENTPSHHIVFFLLGLFPVFLLSVCRGDVGTDTAAYLRIIEDIQNTGSSDLELGFVLLVKAMLFLGMTPRFILIAIAGLVTGLLVYAAQLSERSLLLSAVCIIPVFYLDMTMNGVRYGLSFACAMCAIGAFYQKRFHHCVIFAAFAVLFHLSGWLIFVMAAIFSDDKEEFKQWYILTLGLGILILTLQSIDGILYLFDMDFGQSGVDLEEKVSAYMNFPAPSLFSGLGPLTLSLICLWLIKKTDRANHIVSGRRIYMFLAGVIAAFAVAKFSYAGLRLQFVILFFMLLCLQFKPAFSSIVDSSKKKHILPIMVLVGLLGIAAFMKNALVTEGNGPTPWLPYSLNPDLLDKLDVDFGAD